ncbi:MAG TPA: tRNA-intron lyase [Candidatus Acidoferrales bacterium]|nr:tRNA-intron lyase [Candidatus Acidoferrales bacterium]
MNKKEKLTDSGSEFKIKGLLVEEGVRVNEKESVDELSSRGYGVIEGKELLLTFYEALYLLDKQMLEAADVQGKKVSFQSLVELYESVNENAWAGYLVYRDLRSRGYVVREGFGSRVDFRVYDRGDYSKATAKYLIISVQEGKPTSLEDLTSSLTESLGLKKELVLAVINRRGETVYYSVSELNLK